MKKTALILTAILLVGCGSVKKSSTETEVKKDSTSVKETSISENESGKKETTINYKASTFTFEPIDPQIPYFVDGKEYKGVKVTNKTESEDKKIIEEYERQINTLIDEITKLKEDLRHEQETKEKDYSEVINIVANKLILMLTCFFLIFLVYSYIKNKTTLL